MLVTRIQQPHRAEQEVADVDVGGDARDAASAGVLPERPVSPAGRHRGTAVHPPGDPQRVRAERGGVAGAGLPPVRGGVDDGRLPGEPLRLRGERRDPRDHLRGREPVAFAAVGVVLDVKRQRQRAPVCGVVTVLHGVVGLAGAAADVGYREAIAGRVHPGRLGLSQVVGVEGVSVVIALGGLDERELIARRGHLRPVDRRTVRMLVVGHVNAERSGVHRRGGLGRGHGQLLLDLR